MITIRAREVDGKVEVEVEDSGCGIEPENLQRVFQPFFTTKPPGSGTGLGLSVCHGLVTGWGGSIEVESQPGKGATFRLRLAIGVQMPLPRRPKSAAPAEATTG